MSIDKPFRSKVGVTEGAWQTASLAANWATAAGSNETEQYRLVGSTVQIKGILVRSVSSVAAGTTIFTLSAGWRPATSQFFTSYASTAGFAATVAVVMQVTPAGAVSCISAAVNSGVLLGLHGFIYAGV